MKTMMLLMELGPIQIGLMAVVLLGLASFGPLILGAVLIRERQVGIVVKKFGARSLPPSRLLALGGEAGLQADTLKSRALYWSA